MAPDSGLAQAIGILMILLVLGGLLLGVLLSRILGRRLGWSGAQLLLGTLSLGAIGLGAGAVAVLAIFRHDIWAPPAQVTFNSPPGFAQDWVILLEDREGSTQLVWKGVELPFFTKKAVIAVPPSGIVRMRDLSEVRGPRDIKVVWSDGSCNNGNAGGPAPKSTGATRYVAFNRVEADCGAHPPFLDDEALGTYIAARERGAR
jgi:hypothetical protein